MVVVEIKDNGGVMISIDRVDHINMGVKNLEESKKFYGSVFGFTEKESGVRNGRRWAIIGVPGRLYIALYEKGEVEMLEQDLQVNHFGFHVDNFDEIERSLKAAGYAVDHSWDYGASRSIYVNDPNGYEIELSEKLGGGLN